MNTYYRSKTTALRRPLEPELRFLVAVEDRAGPGPEHPAHLRGQLAPPRRRGGLRLVAPGIERRAGHAQQPAHPGDRVVGLLRIDHRAALRYGCALAKKAAAFFRNSFSIRSRRISSSSSCTLARSVGVNGWSGSGCARR